MRKNIIREGDRVRIVIPTIVTRVGYPKAVNDYLKKAYAKYQRLLNEDMNKYCVGKVLKEIAYGLANADGFGGRERSLHMQDMPGIVGQEFTVSGVRMVQTGTYYPPYVSTSYCGETDYEPGGLANRKVRKLVSGFRLFGESSFVCLTPEIPAEHLEKI